MCRREATKRSKTSCEMVKMLIWGISFCFFRDIDSSRMLEKGRSKTQFSENGKHFGRMHTRSHNMRPSVFGGGKTSRLFSSTFNILSSSSETTQNYLLDSGEFEDEKESLSLLKMWSPGMARRERVCS